MRFPTLKGKTLKVAARDPGARASSFLLKLLQFLGRSFGGISPIHLRLLGKGR